MRRYGLEDNLYVSGAILAPVTCGRHDCHVTACATMRDRRCQGMAKSESKAPKKSPASPPKAAKPKPLPLDERILAILGRDPARSLSAPEIAQMIEPEGDWHAHLMPIRRAAVALMLDGRLVIYRKGKPVEDPEDFRGVYRLGLPKDE